MNAHTFFTGRSLITMIATIHTASVKMIAGVHLKTVSTLFTAVSSISIFITSWNTQEVSSWKKSVFTNYTSLQYRTIKKGNFTLWSDILTFITVVSLPSWLTSPVTDTVNVVTTCTCTNTDFSTIFSIETIRTIWKIFRIFFYLMNSINQTMSNLFITMIKGEKRLI